MEESRMIGHEKDRALSKLNELMAEAVLDGDLDRQLELQKQFKSIEEGIGGTRGKLIDNLGLAA